MHVLEVGLEIAERRWVDPRVGDAEVRAPIAVVDDLLHALAELDVRVIEDWVLPADGQHGEAVEQ